MVDPGSEAQEEMGSSQRGRTKLQVRVGGRHPRRAGRKMRTLSPWRQTSRSTGHGRRLRATKPRVKKDQSSESCARTPGSPKGLADLCGDTARGLFKKFLGKRN